MKSEKKLKIIRIILIVLIVMVPIAFFIGFFVDWKFPSWIYISGSSTIQPLMSEIAKSYTKSQIIVNAGGSSTGLSQMMSGQKQIGMISKSPSVKLAGLPNNLVDGIEENQKWEDDKIKTFTIAWDGIGIIYKTSNKNVKLDINATNATNFFEAFAGLKQFYFHNSNKRIDTNMNDGLKIVPFAKTGGSSLSGTAEAFLENNPFYGQISELTVEILETGTYGMNVIQTDESNLSSWNKIKDYNIQNDELIMTYLSAGFIKNNIDSIEKEGFKVATLNDIPLFDLNGGMNFPKDYKWYRPFNLLFKLSTMDKSLENFIIWFRDQLLQDNSVVKEKINEYGYTTLTSNEISSMSYSIGNKQEFFLSDYELLEKQPDRIKTKNYYGAF